MEEDLARYLYCATLPRLWGIPRSAPRRSILTISHKHANWKSGNFADRFKIVI